MNLKNYLCREAYDKKKLNPGACQRCTSPCEYGRRLLSEMGLSPSSRSSEPLYKATLPYHNTKRLRFLDRR